MTNPAQVEAALNRADAWYAERPWWLENMLTAALEAAESAPKLDPFPFTYPYAGLISDGRGRQSMGYVHDYEVAEGIRFEPREGYSQKLEHYIGASYAAEYYAALEGTK